MRQEVLKTRMNFRFNGFKQTKLTRNDKSETPVTKRLKNLHMYLYCIINWIIYHLIITSFFPNLTTMMDAKVTLWMVTYRRYQKILEDYKKYIKRWNTFHSYFYRIQRFQKIGCINTPIKYFCLFDIVVFSV